MRRRVGLALIAVETVRPLVGEMAANIPAISALASISTRSTVNSAMPDSSSSHDFLINDSLSSHPQPWRLTVSVHERHAAQAHLRLERVAKRQARRTCCPSAR